MPTTRSYGDACGIARALDIVGERWALLVVRELLLGPQRFTDLRRALPGASTNLIADRLRELEGRGVLRRRQLPAPAASRVYELTEWGQELEPVLLALGGWPGDPAPAAARHAQRHFRPALPARLGPARPAGAPGDVPPRARRPGLDRPGRGRPRGGPAGRAGTAGRLAPH